MIIKKLEFINFRNLNNGVITPHSKTNVIYGKNAQGKTNLLEALWMFNGVRSFRGARDNELINFDKQFSSLEMEFFSEEREQTAKIEIKNGKREAYLNDVKKNVPSQLIGKINCIVFSPEHLSLIKDGPSLRRRFIDGAICSFLPRYAIILSRYNKILNQRNALLKDIQYHSELELTLDIWDEKLVSAGAIIIYERIKYINLLKEKAAIFHKGISENKEDLELNYNCSFKLSDKADIKSIEADFLNRLKKRRKEDLYLKYTSTGPHRDDIDIIINGLSAKNYASQGQQRCAVLSLKIAEATIADEITGEKPVILLDDVLSELDLARQNFLINKTENWQVFITCCENDVINKLKEGKIFYVNNGEILEKTFLVNN